MEKKLYDLLLNFIILLCFNSILFYIFCDAIICSPADRIPFLCGCQATEV